MIRVVIASAAEDDFTEALTWYAERSVSAAEGFEAEFERALQTIREEPKRFPPCDDRHRFYLMRRYPFRVIFREEVERVVVIAVAHAKREPRFWEGR
ncbi:MAG: type II toxin-antitoxin system RelE/ParE family toxin [Planctomycetaceae bacterium]|nr:type II toxin-antitoxin system RelE/ParE family toxin [Planctomycetaceae bacterium]